MNVAASSAGPLKRALSTRWTLLVLFVLTVALRLVVLAQYEAQHPLAAHPVIDERSYVEWGARIAGGEWLGREVFFQEPLYPYFIGVVFRLFGEDLHVLRLLQCALGGLTTLFVWAIARRTCGPRAAWVAGLGFAIFPPAMLLPCLLLKPNLFLPIFAALVWLLLAARPDGKRWVAAGILGALGALLRGNLLILLPVIALWPALRAWQTSSALRPAVRGSALFLVGATLVLLPVFARNWAVGGQFALTTSGAGTNVYGGNNADNPHGVATEFDWVRGIPRYEAGDWRREAERRLGRPLDASESSSYWLSQVSASLRANPALHLSIFWNKFRLALNQTEIPDNHHLAWDAQYVPLLRLPWPGFGMWGGLGLAGLLLALARKQLSGDRLQLALLFVLYLGTIVLTVMSMRARLPLVIVLLPFAGDWVARVTQRASLRERLPALACACLGLGFAFFPVFDAAHGEREFAERDHNLVVSWLENDAQLERAAELAQDLATRYPNSSRLQILLADTEWRAGLALIAQGERASGEALVKTALARLRPLTEAQEINLRERSRAFRLAAYIQAGLGNWSAAERFFRAAREFASEDLELLVSHAQALLELSSNQNPGARERRVEARNLLHRVQQRAPDSVEAQAAAELLDSYP